MKRREFLQALGVGAATVMATGGAFDEDMAEKAIGMDEEIDPDLEDFVRLLNELISMDRRPGWVVVTKKTYDMLVMELVPQVRYSDSSIMQKGYDNLLIKGIPVVYLTSRRTV